jgi:pSer/pThr/pTyr-binding forkhead associated (FHA) protein
MSEAIPPWIVVQPEGGVRRFFCRDRFTIGRRDADLLVDDEYASPLHAAVSHDGNGWVIEDLGSTNGTWMAGNHRVREPWRLAKGDKIRIGRTMITVVPG